jgi:uncharacterized protein YqeY
MTFKQRLQEDLKRAMRDKAEARKRTLRMALSAVKLEEVEAGRELTDAEVLAVLQREAKQRRETLEELDRIERPELLATEQADLLILQEYLPQQLSQTEIEDLASQVIADVGAEGPRDTGQVMRVLMPQVKGRADGKLVSQVVRELLSQ